MNICSLVGISTRDRSGAQIHFKLAVTHSAFCSVIVAIGFGPGCDERIVLLAPRRYFSAPLEYSRVFWLGIAGRYYLPQQTSSFSWFLKDEPSKRASRYAERAVLELEAVERSCDREISHR